VGHGDHWRSVLPNLKDGITDALAWLSQGIVVGKREYPALRLPGGGVGATATVIAWPNTGFGASFVIVRDEQRGKTYLHSAFPAANQGRMHEMLIESVHEVSCGLEGRISGRLGDAAVTFFDPLYCLNRDRYRAGALADVDLAGVAYSLRIVPDGTKVRSVVGDVDLKGAAILWRPHRKPEQATRSCGDEQAIRVRCDSDLEIRSGS
jgi:hypothetical protein